MKTCTKCLEAKEITEFSKNYNCSDGLQKYCKKCIAENGSRWRKANADRHRSNTASWQKANPEKHRKNVELWQKANPDRGRELRKRWVENNRAWCNEKSAIWQKENSDKVNVMQARRRAAKLRAIPSWANPAAIRVFYETARDRTKTTGIEHHVDHIVPLQGKTVCGLHAENNLSVITGIENSKKQNLFWPDMP
jgi:hypothetical protein